jgi:hypothetical protein
MLAIVGFFLLQFQILPSNSLILVSNAPRRVIKTLKASNGAPWGGWGPPQFCAEGTYAIGYSIKVLKLFIYPDMLIVQAKQPRQSNSLKL